MNTDKDNSGCVITIDTKVEKRGSPKLYAGTFLVFVASLVATIYFSRSMSGLMPMPGGWTMSMTWMRMPGQTWPAAFAMFMAMWLAMMVAMMLPSALPMILRFHNAWGIAIGYFLAWQIIGVSVFVVGFAVMGAAMRWAFVSRIVPALAGFAVLLSGIIQLSLWKMEGLRLCRDPLHCLSAQTESWLTDLKSGIRCGLNCAACCSGWMLILFVMGSMNLAVMGIVAVLIALEKLMPQPERIVRASGIAAGLVGIGMLVYLFFRP